MKGTFKIRNAEGECLCALFTEDYVFFNALNDDKAKELFEDFLDGGFITVSDVEMKTNFFIAEGEYLSSQLNPEYFLISLLTAFKCKDFKEFLFKCKELPYDSKEENGNG